MKSDIGTLNTTRTTWLPLFRDAFLFILFVSRCVYIRCCFAMHIPIYFVSRCVILRVCFMLRVSILLALRISVCCFVLLVSTRFTLAVSRCVYLYR